MRNKRKVCAILGISRSTVYYKRKTPPEDPLESEVIEEFHRHNGNYGARRLKAVFNGRNKIISRHRVGRILKRNSLESKHGRGRLARNIHTSTSQQFIAENLIKGQAVTASNEICQMDASVFKHKTGKLIVSGIIDIYDKTVTAAYGTKENKELTTAAIIKRFEMGCPRILHSDRGAANASLAVKQLLEKEHVSRSMSAPYSPHENQYIETFWKSAKTEIGETKHLTQEQLEMVLDYYVHYYNNERIHSSIGYLTPSQKRRLSLDGYGEVSAGLS